MADNNGSAPLVSPYTLKQNNNSTQVTDQDQGQGIEIKVKSLGFLSTTAVDGILSTLGESNTFLTDLGKWKTDALKRTRAGTVWSLNEFIILSSRGTDILGRHGLHFSPDFTMWDIKTQKEVVEDLPDDQVLGAVPLYGFYFFDTENSRTWSYSAMVIYQMHLLCQYVGV